MAANSSTIYSTLFITIFFLVVFVILLYQTTRKHRSAPYFIISFFFGFLGGLFSYLDSISTPKGLDWMNIFELIFFGLQFMFLFVFLEKLRTLKLDALRWSIAIVIFAFQIFSLMVIVAFVNIPVYSNALPVFWNIANYSNDILSLYVYVAIGFPVYIKTYVYAKENRPLIMILALILASVGFLFMSTSDFLNFFETPPAWILNWGYILPLVGLLIFMLCYLTDIDYIYRLPNDNYILMVSYKSGITIHTIRFKTRTRHVTVEENLLSGLISSISMVFKSVLESQADVQDILSKDVTILMESGKYVMVTMVADNVSAILSKSLKRYVRKFEEKFMKQLETEDKLISDFDSAIELLKPVFPYLVVQK